MRVSSILFSAIALWTCLTGCSGKPLQDSGPDGGGGSGRGGAGGHDVSPPDGGEPDVSLAGGRSYLVTSLLQRDGGIGSAPTSHTFTLVLSADRRTAIAGGATGGAVLTLEQTAAGALHVVAPLHLSINPDPCSGTSVQYTNLIFTVDAGNRLTGTGSGTLYLLQGDVAENVSATMSLTGAADTQPPALRISGSFFDPLLPFSVQASEPLPLTASATLSAEDGEMFAMPGRSTTPNFVTQFEKPATTLRYGMRYQVLVDGVTDFAGNAVTDRASLIFFTKARPPLLAAQDGFESLTDTTFAGVSVLTSADGPVITGTKSLYIAPATGGSITNPPTQPELALRIPVEPGDTTVRFAYRTVKTGTTSFSYGATWILGNERGTATGPALPADTGMATTVTSGGTTWTLGPVTTASFPLPADAAGEVVLQRTFSVTTSNCGPPRPPLSVDGIIIDELRAE